MKSVHRKMAIDYLVESTELTADTADHFLDLLMKMVREEVLGIVSPTSTHHTSTTSERPAAKKV